MRSDREPAGQSKTRGAPRGGFHSTTPGFTGPRVPATGPRRTGTDLPVDPARNSLRFVVLLCGDRRLLAPAELGAVDPHTMEHGPHLAGQRDLRPLQAAAPGNFHRPALECGEARRPAQYRIGRLVEGRAHHGVTHLADPADYVGLAGLVALGREAEMGPDRLGGSEPAGVIHRRPEGDRHQRAWSHVIM